MNQVRLFERMDSMKHNAGRPPRFVERVIDSALTPEVMKESIRKLPVIVADQVAELVFADPSRAWTPKDIPNAAPPFEEFFVEWTAQGPSERETDTQITAMVAFSCIKINGPRELELQRARSRVSGAPPVFASTAMIGKWVCSADVLTDVGGVGDSPGPIFQAGFVHYAVDEKGAIVDVLGKPFHSSPSLNLRELLRGMADRFLIEIVQVALVAVTFMHSRSATLSEHTLQAPRWARRRAEKEGRKPPAPIRYHVLEIEPVVEMLKAQGGLGSGSGLKKALHLCRGHFRIYGVLDKETGTYKPKGDKGGIFGRRSPESYGMFWTPSHERGSEERGRVEKDYDVKTPREGEAEPPSPDAPRANGGLEALRVLERRYQGTNSPVEREAILDEAQRVSGRLGGYPSCDHCLVFVEWKDGLCQTCWPQFSPDD